MGVASLDLQQTDAGQGKIDYGNIINKPKINGITLEGDLSTEEIGIIIPTALSELENDTGFITSDVDDLVNYYDKETVDEKISLIPKFDIKVVQELPTEDISPTTLYLLVAEGDDHYVEYIYVDGEWDELGNGNIDLSDYTTYEYVDGELAKKANTADLATVATSGSYSDLSGTPTRLGQFTNDVGYITSSALPTKTSDLTNDGEDGSSTYVENSDLATVATSGSYNDLTDKPTIDFELVELSYGESNAWAKFIAAYQGHKIVYCRASSNSNPATGTQGRKAFMAYVNNADNPTEVEFQYVRSVSTKTSSQPVDQVYVYKLTSANGGTWTVQTRDMGPKLAQGTNTNVSYSNGTYTISATQPTVNDATLTIQKNGTTVETFSANSSTNKTANITVPTKTSDVTNDSDFVNSTQVGNALAAYTYPSQDLYTQSDIDTMLAQISSLKIEVVNALPQTGSADTIYLLRVRQQGDDVYQEYFWVNNTWELIGGVDLTDYYTKTQTDTLLNAKADTSDIPTKTSDLTNDSNFPVDANYVHTDNNYTTAEKNKLAGIAAGAEVNVQSDWNQSSSSADDFIKNKPSIPSKTSDLTNDSGFITTAAIPTNVSVFNNDAGYLDSIPDDSVGLNQLDDTVVNALDRINDKADTADLAAVAFSGDYDDLSDKPTIPTVNNATLTIQKNGTNVQTFTANSSTNKTANITVPTKTSDITNDGSDGTSTYAETDDLATVATTGSYNDLVDKPTIPSGQIQSDWTQTNTSEVDYIKNKPTLATVATSGSYNDLSNKPTIPTVNNATLTIQKNGANVQTFTANSSSNKTANITVPTKTSDVTNDGADGTSTYVESDELATVATSGSYNDLSNKPTIPTVNDATLTIQKNSSNVGTFTANASSNKTINIAVPTTAADVSALPASTKYGASISVSINTTDYKVTTTLKDQDGNTLGTAQVIDLPLESVVVSGSYDSTNKKIILTLQSGSTIDIPVGDLVAGLQSEITSTNKLASDLVDDTNQTHKFMTSAEKTKLSGIATGAEVNVQSDWTQTTTTADDYIKNKPTLATVATSGSYNDLSNKPTIPTVNNATLTIQKNGTTVKTFTANASSNVTANITVPTKTSDITNDSNFVASGDLAAVATSGSYNDLSNKPTIPTVNNGTLTVTQNGTSKGTFTANQSGNSTIALTDTTYSAGTNIDITSNTIKTKTLGVEYIIGTQTGSTNVWTGVSTDTGCSSSTVYTGKVIIYHLPYAGTSSAATLNLTLPDGTTTGAKNVRANASTNVTTHYGAGCDIFLVFDGTYWKASPWYDSNNYDRIRHNSNVKVAAAITNGQICVGTSAGYKPIASGATFDITYPILRSGDNSVAGDVKTNFYDVLTANLQNNKSGWTGTAYTQTWLVGTLSGTTFTIDSDVFTQTVPSSADGKVYTPLGITYDTKQIFMFPTNEYWEYRNGSFSPISTCPTLATVATSGSYNDLSNKPTIPTVNNATLTIQKNGTNVQTFTANQSTNATANITVPTKTSELTNDSSFVTSSGTVSKANQLATARTIAISGGATGTATSFNGTSNISIPVTDVKDAYVTWGGKSLASNVTPDDMGCVDEFGHNKLAFLPAECIEIKYSTDGGSSWVDYGASDANKVKMVTTAGPGFYVGGSTDNATASNIANLKLRIRIACGPTTGGRLYTAAKKMLINVSTQGAGGNKVDIRYRTIANYVAGTETWSNVGTFDVAGGSGWNSIPFNYTWGGSFTSQTSQIGQFEFVFYSTSLGTWGLKKLSAIDFRLIGSTNWSMPSEMARAGHLYTVDEGQNATFPANVSITGSLKHSSYTYTLPNKTGTVAMTSDIPSVPTVNNGTLTIQKNGTNVQTFTANQSTNATANITVPTKISDLTNTSGGFITYCTCSTAAATAAKVVTLDSGDSNWALRKGAIIGVKFTNSNTASSVTLNVNSTGAKSIYYNNAAYTGSSNSICGYANRYTFYMYDGTYWVWISDGRHDGNDNTYTTAYCSTAAGTAAKVASMTGYTLTANRYTVITFTNANSAASALTLNINSKGAKPLYINGAASSSSNYTLAAGSYIVYYDGTNYYINNNGEIPRMIHSESPVSTSAVTPIISNSMISDGTITFAKTATGEFLKLTLTTTDPGAGSALAANTLLGVYE